MATRITTANQPVAALLARHREFLAFVERRVNDREAAEDILQSAFLKGIAKADSIRDDRNVVAWFYRLLRNGLADHYRRQSAEQRALDRHGGCEPTTAAPDGEALDRTPCRCVAELLHALPPQYAAILQRVELDGASVGEVASELGLSSNNVRVRLHRSRRALRTRVELFCGTCAEEGCQDCACVRFSVT